MRNVPRFFALASNPAESSIDPKQIGISALPVAEEGLQSYSSLGGWNLFMNANTRDPDAAYGFTRFMSTLEQQKIRSIEGSVLPTRQELYENEEILQGEQVAEFGQEAIRNTRPRPVSPFYSDMSLRTPRSSSGRSGVKFRRTRSSRRCKTSSKRSSTRADSKASRQHEVLRAAHLAC